MCHFTQEVIVGHRFVVFLLGQGSGWGLCETKCTKTQLGLHVL